MAIQRIVITFQPKKPSQLAEDAQKGKRIEAEAGRKPETKFSFPEPPGKSVLF